MEIPTDLIEKFTLNGKVGVEKWYLPPVFQNEHNYDEFYTSDEIEKLKLKVFDGIEYHYIGTDTWVQSAMKKYMFDKNVIVIGSARPWYETMCLCYGCKSCTIVEYLQRHSDRTDLRYITTDKFKVEIDQGIKYDICLSISSIEHDGLGRYGDPIDPDADLRDMSESSKILNDNGLLMLAVPVGKDKVVWNAHRIYGTLRLPLLLKDWNIVETYGIEKDYMNDSVTSRDTGVDAVLQPLFILKK